MKLIELAFLLNIGLCSWAGFGFFFFYVAMDERLAAFSTFAQGNLQVS